MMSIKHRNSFLLLCCITILLLTGCSKGPESTVKAFWKAVVDGDMSKATSYVESGFDPSFVANSARLGTYDDEIKREFFRYCSSSTLEQTENSAKVRWHIDFRGMMGGESFQSIGFTNEQADLFNQLLDAISELDFTLKKVGGSWKITWIMPSGGMDVLNKFDPQAIQNMRDARGR